MKIGFFVDKNEWEFTVSLWKILVHDEFVRGFTMAFWRWRVTVILQDKEAFKNEIRKTKP
ncbi:unnamed protein product [marine sediment metagenome]|uniref:Uncharacterized protein n=1 Tax=marine sediment metagenome TaxID=412755 RepID=X1V4X7_9ZZZZ